MLFVGQHNKLCSLQLTRTSTVPLPLPATIQPSQDFSLSNTLSDTTTNRRDEVKGKETSSLYSSFSVGIPSIMVGYNLSLWVAKTSPWEDTLAQRITDRINPFPRITEAVFSLNTGHISQRIVCISPLDPKWSTNRVQVEKSQSFLWRTLAWLALSYTSMVSIIVK